MDEQGKASSSSIYSAATKDRVEPTVVHEHRQAEDILKSLRRLAPKVFGVVEGEAQELRLAPELPGEAP